MLSLYGVTTGPSHEGSYLCQTLFIIAPNEILARGQLNCFDTMTEFEIRLKGTQQAENAFVLWF